MMVVTEAEHDESADDFLGALVTDENPVRDTVESSDEAARSSSADEDVYRNRKPKWWLQKSRKASKAQRRAINAMDDYRLARAPYGEVLDLHSVFSVKEGDPVDVWVEIGFGAGENLLRLAEQYHHTSRRFIGAEIHAPGIGKAFQRMQESIQEKRFWKDYTLYSRQIDPACADSDPNESDDSPRKANDDDQNAHVDGPYSNLRIHRGDGIKLLPYIADNSIAAVLVTNPGKLQLQISTNHCLNFASDHASPYISQIPFQMPKKSGA
jgi:tRNA G46 methylase TrmB